MEENKEIEQQENNNQVQNYTVQDNVVSENKREETDVVKENDKPIVVNGETVTPDLDASINVDTTIHDGADYSVKKPDFIIKSKKDVVAEELEERNKKIQEKIDKANANYKPNGPFKTFMLLFFFVFLFFFIFFLPDIRSYVETMKKGNQEEDKIVNGYLSCSFEKNTDTLEIKYSYTFKFIENKLYYLSSETSFRGDIVEDVDELKDLYNNCVNLKNQVKSLDGISVSCNNSSGKFTKSESFEYKSIDKEKITAAYSEAEGLYPNYENDQDMDDIETKMNMSGYECTRKAS